MTVLTPAATSASMSRSTCMQNQKGEMEGEF